MGESDKPHPYRAEPTPTSPGAATPRHIPWVVRVHVLFGDAIGVIGMFIPASLVMCAWSPRGLLFILATVALAVWLLIHVSRQMHSLRLLQLGRVAYGTLTSKEEIGRGVFDDDESPKEYRLGFRFEDRGKTYDISVRTTVPRPLVDDPREQLVFLPDDPLSAELVDTLPGRPRIREDNTISPSEHMPGATLVFMLLAGVLVIGTIDVWLWLR